MKWNKKCCKIIPRDHSDDNKGGFISVYSVCLSQITNLFPELIINNMNKIPSASRPVFIFHGEKSDVLFLFRFKFYLFFLVIESAGEISLHPFSFPPLPRFVSSSRSWFGVKRPRRVFLWRNVKLMLSEGSSSGNNEAVGGNLTGSLCSGSEPAESRADRNQVWQLLDFHSKVGLMKRGHKHAARLILPPSANFQNVSELLNNLKFISF